MCKKCRKKHHTLLHLHKQNQPTNDSGSTSNNSPTTEKGNTSTDSASERGSPTEEVNSYCSVKSNTKGHVLLATAIVEVMNKAGQFIPCRALLDSGSQTHFITERCRQRLNLPKKRMNTLIQGISNVNTVASHSTSVFVRSRTTDWYSTMECAVLTNIANTIPPARIDISKWNIPKDIILAD
jgi:hypothetical protein